MKLHFCLKKKKQHCKTMLTDISQPFRHLNWLFPSFLRNIYFTVAWRKPKRNTLPYCVLEMSNCMRICARKTAELRNVNRCSTNSSFALSYPPLQSVTCLRNSRVKKVINNFAAVKGMKGRVITKSYRLSCLYSSLVFCPLFIWIMRAERK